MPTRKDGGEAAIDLHTKPVTYDNAQRSETKIRNLDVMLAQLCTLDRALDSKASSKKRKSARDSEPRDRRTRHADRKEKSRKKPAEIEDSKSKKRDQGRYAPRDGARESERAGGDADASRQTPKDKQTRPQQSVRSTRANASDSRKVHDAVAICSRRGTGEILSKDEANCCSSGSNGAVGDAAVYSTTHSGGRPRSLNNGSSGSGGGGGGGGGSASGRKDKGSRSSLNEIEHNIREMAQAIGIHPEVSCGGGGKPEHDLAYEEEVLRSNVRPISVVDDDFNVFKMGARLGNEAEAKNHCSNSGFALKFDEISIKDADDALESTNGDCDVTTEGARASRIRPRGVEHEMRDFNGVFVPKKTERSLDKSACGDIHDVDEKTRAQPRLAPQEIPDDTGKCDRRQVAAVGERKSHSSGEKGASHSAEESCRVIVVRNPKLYPKQKKSSHKEKRDKEGCERADRSEEKTGNRKQKAEKHKKHKKRKDDVGAGNVDLAGQFENYIGGEALEYKSPPSGKQEKLDDQARSPNFHKSREVDEEKKRRRAERKMLEKRNNKASSSDEGIARSPSKTKKHGGTLQKRDSRRDQTTDNMHSSRRLRQHAAHDSAISNRDLERLLKAREASRRDGRDEEASVRAYGLRPVRKPDEPRTKARQPAAEKHVEASRATKASSKALAERRADQMGGHAPPLRSSRMQDAANWHTGVYDAKTLVRPGRRDSRSKTDAKYAHGRRRTHRRHSSPSDLSTSSYSSLSPSSASSSSSYATSDVSSVEMPRTDGRRTRAGKHSKHIRSRSSSRESGGAGGNGEKRVNGNAKPQYRKSASSTSSFQRRPTDSNAVAEDKRRKAEKLNHAKRKEDGVQGRGHSPTDDKTPEMQFGAHRKKRTNTSVKAEGEDSHSLWQHHQLVVISQKPESKSKTDGQKQAAAKPSQQPQQPASAQKKPVSSGGGVDKRSLTIRDLYSLHNVLSDTQNGTVISGYRRSDGLRVAIKRISKAGTTRWGWLGGKVVPLELALLCQVNEVRSHGIVEIVEWHETTEAFLLVMVRPHPAVDLYDYVSKRKRVKEALARHIIRQLVNALQHCIKCGVLHRDVKLENILLNPETMNMTLIDFGCGDYIRNGTYKEFAGTPEYYPPEWFARKQYNGETLTVWSIGVLLYSLLCGSLPYRSSKEIIEKEATKFPSDVSRGAKEIVASMLLKNPRDRPSLSNILTHPWLKSSKSGSST